MGLARVPKDKRLDGKIALITGGTAGIGYETALEFAKRGATIILAARDAKKVTENKCFPIRKLKKCVLYLCRDNKL